MAGAVWHAPRHSKHKCSKPQKPIRLRTCLPSTHHLAEAGARFFLVFTFLFYFVALHGNIIISFRVHALWYSHQFALATKKNLRIQCVAK